MSYAATALSGAKIIADQGMSARLGRFDGWAHHQCLFPQGNAEHRKTFSSRSGACTGKLGPQEITAFDPDRIGSDRINEMVADPRDVLQNLRGRVPVGQMVVDLTHFPSMGDDGQPSSVAAGLPRRRQ